jgi:hypothetical protein
MLSRTVQLNICLLNQLKSFSFVRGVTSPRLNTLTREMRQNRMVP